MIGRKGTVLLYQKQEDNNQILIELFKSGKISTYWRKRNKENGIKLAKKYRKEYHKILHNLKINGCAICGYNECDDALAFHHVNPEDKKFSL